MPFSLDTLLFWVGLGLLIVGLFVFITGKTMPTDKKEQSNRFEAFGIKVDVNNPSLILIILGVVMMLAPKMMPSSLLEEGKETETKAVASSLTVDQGSESEKLTPTPKDNAVMPTGGQQSDSSASLPQAKPFADQTIMAETVQVGEGKSMAALGSSNTTGQASTIAGIGLSTDVTPAAAQKPVNLDTDLNIKLPADILQAKPETVTESKPVAAKPATKPEAKPAPVVMNKPAPQTKPLVVAKAVAPPPAKPAKPVLMLAVQADSNSRAGITASADEYSQQIAAELTNLVKQDFGDISDIRQTNLTEFRQVLKKDNQPYKALCEKAAGDRLLLADIEVPFVWGSEIPSAFWPDLRLYLVDCKTLKQRQRTRPHLVPNVKDTFPFQQAIRANATGFLDDYGRMLEAQ